MKTNRFIWIYVGVIVLLFAGGIITFRVRWRVCETCGLQRYQRMMYGLTLKGYAEGAIDPRGPYDHAGFDPDRRAYAYQELYGVCEHKWQDRYAGIFGRDPDFQPERVPLSYPPPPEIVAWLDIHLRGLPPPDEASTDSAAVATPPAPVEATDDSPASTP